MRQVTASSIKISPRENKIFVLSDRCTHKGEKKGRKKYIQRARAHMFLCSRQTPAALFVIISKRRSRICFNLRFDVFVAFPSAFIANTLRRAPALICQKIIKSGRAVRVAFPDEIAATPRNAETSVQDVGVQQISGKCVCEIFLIDDPFRSARDRRFRISNNGV